MSADSTPLNSRRGFVLLLAFLILAAAGKSVLYDTLDPDAFWHLRVAGQLHTDGIHPLTDTLSFASLKTPWVPYSWLAELGMKALWDAAGANHGGYRAAVAAQAACVAAFITLVALSALAFSRPPLNKTQQLVPTPPPGFLPQRFPLAAYGFGPEFPSPEQEIPPTRYMAVLVATFAATFLSLPYLSFRPVTFALVLLALIAYLLLTDRKAGERTRRVWIIPPLTAALTNLHLFAFFVPLWVAALLIGSLTERAGRSTRRYATLLALTVVGYCCTPLLPGVLATVGHYQFADVMVNGPVIAEFQPFYRGTMGIVSAVLAAGVLTCAILRPRSLRTGEWLWLAGSVALLLRMGRFSPVFAIVAAPVLAATLPTLSDRVLTRQPLQAALAGLLLLAVGRVAVSFPTDPAGLDAWLNRMAPVGAAYPCAAAGYVENDLPHTTGRVVNELNWGGYLAWRLGGDQVFLDGRTQLYSADFWRAAYLGGEANRRALLANVTADAAILPVKGSAFRPALQALGWRPVFSDANAEVLIPPSDAQATLRDYSDSEN